jgi:hypothetical protein
MDEQVRAALAKWPHVPDCMGWLALDARGRWRIGDAKDGPRQPITNAAMLAFINRNYGPQGRCWIFQNGPQRVFVELEYTPFVWRLVPGDGAWQLTSHTGETVTPVTAWLDSDGRFLFEARRGQEPAVAGVVHDHDTALVADLLRDEGGAPLGDDALTRLSAEQACNVAETGVPDTRVHWATSSGPVTLALQRIASQQVPARFGFESHPSLAVRVDVDTRR